MVHICSKRYVDRTEKTISVKVYSNQPEVKLYCNGTLLETKQGDRVFTFRVPLTGEIQLRAVAGDWEDTAIFRRVKRKNPSYKLRKTKKKSQNWV